MSRGVPFDALTLRSVIDCSPLKVLPELSLSEAVKLMSVGKNYRGLSQNLNHTTNAPECSSYLLVFEDETLQGIVTERDVVKLTSQGIDFKEASVADVMTRTVVTIRESNLNSLVSVLNLFHDHRIRHLPILDEEDRIIGVATPSNMRRLLQSSDLFRLRQVEEVMSTHVITASPETSAFEIARLMAYHRVSCIVITQKNEIGRAANTPLGIITERDIVKFQSSGLNLIHYEAQSLMSLPLFCLSSQDNLWIAYQMMERSRVRRLVICDSLGQLVGIVTQTSILTAFDPIEMQKTISLLRQQLDQLQSEKVQHLQIQTSDLKTQVESTEQRFNAIFNQTFQLMGLLQPDGTLLEANQTALDFGGVNREDVIDQPFWDTCWWQTTPETQHQLKDAIARAAQGEFVRYEVDILGKDYTATIDFSLRPIFDENGSVKLLIPEGRDITERKQVEAAKHKLEQRFAKLAEAAPVGIFQMDIAGKCLYVNERWCHITGLTPEQATGNGWEQGIHHEDWNMVIQEWLQTLHNQHPFHLEYRLETPQHEIKWVCGQAVAEYDTDGQISGYIGTINDITHRKDAEIKLKNLNQDLEARVLSRTRELEASQERYRLFYKKTPVMLYSLNNQGLLCSVSDYWLERLGYTREEVIGRPLTDFLTSESRDLTEVFLEYLEVGVCSEFPCQILSKAGEVIDVALSAMNEWDETGQPLSLAVMTDVTQRKRIEQELFREKELAQVTLHSIGDAVITTNEDGIVEYVNPVAERLTGWTTQEASGKALLEVFLIIDETTREPVENPIERVLRDGSVTGLAHHTTLISKDGTEYAIEDSAAPIRTRNGTMIGAVIVFHDVTESRQLARQLYWQARHDSLTHLDNRRQFEQDLCQLLLKIPEENSSHVLCYLDLDQFKVVNDTCGHLAGDELLRQVATLLQKHIRMTDTLARLGGDEFGILLTQCSLEQAKIIAETLRQAIKAFRFHWQQNTFSIGVSIGLVALDTKGSYSLTEVLSAADAACYAAKEGGRNRLHIYKTDDSDLLKQRGERRWSVRIKRALEEDRFCLYRQTIANTIQPDETQHFHYEILIRMIDEDGQIILPGSFIAAAERYNLMTEIDRWVVQHFFTQIEQARHQSTGLGTFSDSLHFINLSGASIGDKEFLGFLKEQFVRYSVLPHTIGFEITETAAIANISQSTDFIHELKQLGCRFALDDFGSGMSSFGYLKALPIDYLKIDGEFILDIIDDPANYAIVEAINHIGHVLGLKTIAEFVENQAFQEQVAKIGVDYVQGYSIDRPSPISCLDH